MCVVVKDNVLEVPGNQKALKCGNRDPRPKICFESNKDFFFFSAKSKMLQFAHNLSVRSGTTESGAGTLEYVEAPLLPGGYI